MADTRNAGRIKKYGVCLNDKCEKYKQIQEILHGDLECPECKKKLSPCAPPKKKSNKTPIYIGIGVVVAIAIIVGCIVAFGGGRSEEPIAAVDSLTVDSANIVKSDTVTVVKTDTVKQVDTVTVEKVVEKKVAVPVASKKTSTSPSSSSKGCNLGYAKFAGSVKNGRPNGMGRMTFSSSHVIDGRDSKGRIADAGDYVVGEWKDGKLVQGRWYGSDNNVKGSIIIGM